MQKDISSIRREYRLKELSAAAVRPSPLEQFGIWLDEAISARVHEPTAMTLATAGSGGQPSARTVLLKDISADGLSFFTNYESKKGRQLSENSLAALVFFWPELERQARFEGTVERLPGSESDRYFASRPRESRIGAWASKQSSMILSREALEKEVRLVTSRYQDLDIPRPPFWGGYRLVPHLAEFWQGRPGRLHDRIEYRLKKGSWNIQRLSP
ncbi:MAG: pyridoxamine 5'-phosphate oxidase [Marinilabiliales bacterium]|nr:MAG: pyridoxamine 5'-phosphate oxidase [Marinilabiliales bacterium]